MGNHTAGIPHVLRVCRALIELFYGGFPQVPQLGFLPSGCVQAPGRSCKDEQVENLFFQWFNVFGCIQGAMVPVFFRKLYLYKLTQGFNSGPPSVGLPVSDAFLGLAWGQHVCK